MKTTDGQEKDVTRRAFELIGHPVAHSLSPAMHNALYQHLGLDWEYESVDCENEADAVAQIERLRSGDLQGMNVTMPYKPLALAESDDADLPAQAAGGANVLLCTSEGLHAYNTDGIGAVSAIERDVGVKPASKTVAVAGTGPTSLAIATSLAQAGADRLYLFSRETDKAEHAIERIEDALGSGAPCFFSAAGYGEASRIVPQVDIFVDATPRGMMADDEAIVDTSLFGSGQVVLDTVYGHGISALVAGARESGAVAFDGLGMLVEQAAASVEIWMAAFGVDLPVDRDVMRDAAQGGA